MSFRLIAEAWASGVPPIDRLVLVALADWANESGQCWPSMPTIAEKTGVDVRTARRVMARLEAGGCISTIRKPGRGILYTVHPGHAVPPDTLSPRTENTQTPDTLSPNTPRTVSNRDKSVRAKTRPAAASGSRLASDFAPPNEWIEWAMAERGWTAADVSAEADVFRDYWVAQPGAAGRKADWLATWRNWVRRSRRQSSITGGEHGQRTFGDRRGGGAGAARDRGRPLDGFVAALREVQAGGNAHDDGRG